MSGHRTIRTIALLFSALLPLCAFSAQADGGGELLMQADTGTYDTKNDVVSADGHVEIDYKGRILFADKVIYEQKIDRIVAKGHVRLMDEDGNVAFADSVVLSNAMREGALEGFGALLGKYGRLAAASATRRNGRYTDAKLAVYSNCEICNQPGKRTPLWQIKAVRIVHDGEKKKIAFKDATIEIEGVPIFYTPYLRVPDPTVHYYSGFLMPDSGSSSSIGYFLRTPYYISISEAEDATVSPLVSTRGGVVLLGEYRKRWSERSGLWLQASGAENPNGGANETEQQMYSHLFGSGRFAVNDTWMTGFDAQVSSKDTYLKRYDISQLDRLMSDIFVSGENGRSRFAVTGYFFQSLRTSDDNNTFPVALPLVEYSYIPLDRWLGGQFRLDVNAVALSRDIGENDQRLSAKARWRLPHIAADGEMWTFQLDGRGDFYHTDTPDAAGNSHYTTRGLPSAALDWRWPFIAQGKNGKSFIVEPIAQMIAAPYGGNPHTVPNEDSYGLEIDDNNIFSFDQVPGYDLLESGPRANFGFRAESRFESGYAEALIGQSFRLKSDPIFADESSGQTGTSSDIVGRFSVKFPPYMDVTHRIAYNERTGKVRRNEVYLTGIYGRSSLQINYVQLSAGEDLSAREEINTQIDLNFYQNWQVFAAIRRDLIADQTFSNEFGIGYENECLGISLAYKQKFTSDRDLKPSTAILVHFNLKTTDAPIRPFSLFPRDVFSYTRN
jgi:LPS-assembly protein